MFIMHIMRTIPFLPVSATLLAVVLSLASLSLLAARLLVLLVKNEKWKNDNSSLKNDLVRCHEAFAYAMNSLNYISILYGNIFRWQNLWADEGEMSLMFIKLCAIVARAKSFGWRMLTQKVGLQQQQNDESID